MTMTGSLDMFLRPRSIAVVGASSDPSRIGGRPLRYLREAGFAGAVYPVNPARTSVQGLTAYASIAAIPETVECAMIVVPAENVAPAVTACAAKGVRGIVIFSAGFAETGGGGAALQDSIVRTAQAAGMRILGPNCLGAYSAHDNVFLTFSGVFDDVVGNRGRFGFVSQSGGFAGEIVKVAKAQGLDIGTWVTTGNEADVELGEVLCHLADDPNVDVIAGFIEGARNRKTFLRGLAQARARKKPVIVLKAGRSEAGAHAVRSHTAGLAGADAVYDAIFDTYGVHRARTIEEMLDVMYACRRGIYPASRRVAIVTNSGGNGALAADVASDVGLTLPMPSNAVSDAVRAMSPHAATGNPMDLTAQVANDPTLFSRALDMLLGEGSLAGPYAAVHSFIGLIAGIPYLAEPVAAALTGVATRHPDRLLTLSVTTSHERIAQYEAAGFLVFQDPSRAVRALGAVLAFGRSFMRTPSPSRAPVHTPLPPGTGTLNELASKEILARIGIPSPTEVVASGEEDGENAARRMRCPVAIKVVSPDILHKTDAGGVALDVQLPDVAAAIRRMRQSVREREPGARIDGYLVTPMLRAPFQFFLGAHIDAVFGPVVVVGLGGVAVELLRDTTCTLAPVDRSDARAMIERLKSFPLLNGYRGQPPLDVEAFASAIVAVGDLIADEQRRVQSVDVNPLVVLECGRGVVALDAVIELASPGSAKISAPGPDPELIARRSDVA